jgi:hypothetical protein
MHSLDYQENSDKVVLVYRHESVAGGVDFGVNGQVDGL